MTVTLAIDNDWGSGYCATVSLANESSTDVTDWAVVKDLGGSTVNNLWSGRYTQNAGSVTVEPESYNALIRPDGTVSYGFCASGSGRPTITSISITGGGADDTTGTGGGASTGGSATGGGGTGGSSTGGGDVNVCATADENASATLTCPAGTTVSSIRFASYGTPTGSCGSFSTSGCHASSSESVVRDACLGRNSCSVAATNGNFGDPCRGTRKRVTIEATCTSGDGGGTGGGTSTGGGTGTGGGTSTGACDPYEWPEYTPELDWELPGSDIDPNTLSVYQGCDPNLVAGTMTSGWWSFTWGHDRNPQITDQQIQRVLDGLNEDMGYIRDIMGWPPDPMPQDGYFSSVYLYGSGLCTDNASNTAQGGWQSNIGPYPMVLLSWAPVVNYDRGGITHEAIHAMVKGMPGGNNKAHWFNEGGNTWIQMQLGARRDNDYGVGFLDGVPFVAPHQPIESYSGWLLDGSFGGPDAQGVGDCNWRRYLGGTQYNSILSHFLAQHVSEGANAWVWAQANPRNILETLAKGLGEEQTRRLVMEYRARQALVDLGPWRDSIINRGINNTWGQSLNRECGTGVNPPNYVASAYAPTTTQGNTIIPDEYTLPGWSGANQIPLNVSGNEVRLNFNPEDPNMRMQLAYWAEDGTAVYSQPVESGEACLRLDKAPNDGVVIAVVSNTDYVYQGEATRHAKYDYTVDMVEGVTSTASRTTRWFLK